MDCSVDTPSVELSPGQPSMLKVESRHLLEEYGQGRLCSALQYLTPLFYYIPQASLAVVIIMAVIDMITFQKLWIFWKTRKIDLIPWIVTLVLSLVLSIAYGVLIGAGLSLLLLLYPASRPRIKKLKYDPASLLHCKHIDAEGSKIVLVTFNSGLMYPAIEYLKDKLIPLYSTGISTSTVQLSVPQQYKY